MHSSPGACSRSRGLLCLSNRQPLLPSFAVGASAAVVDICCACGHVWVPRRSVTSLRALRWLTEAMCRGMRDQLNS
ncbi:Uncharacterised protein [Mycobacteroides abscessus subsp. abscessus]|nr:Uncharacterised protein [Mycobacteroides abscessus subsp. abscessus]